MSLRVESGAVNQASMHSQTRPADQTSSRRDCSPSDTIESTASWNPLSGLANWFLSFFIVQEISYFLWQIGMKWAQLMSWLSGEESYARIYNYQVPTVFDDDKKDRCLEKIKGEFFAELHTTIQTESLTEDTLREFSHIRIPPALRSEHKEECQAAIKGALGNIIEKLFRKDPERAIIFVGKNWSETDTSITHQELNIISPDFIQALIELLKDQKVPIQGLNIQNLIVPDKIPAFLEALRLNKTLKVLHAKLPGGRDEVVNQLILDYIKALPGIIKGHPAMKICYLECEGRKPAELTEQLLKAVEDSVFQKNEKLPEDSQLKYLPRFIS